MRSTQPPKPPLSRQILEAASSWFVDFRVGDIDSEARERFDAWLRQSPEHIRAYMEIAQTFVELPDEFKPAAMDGLLIQSADSHANVVQFDSSAREVAAGFSPAIETTPLLSRKTAGVRAKTPRSWLSGRSLAASIAGAAVATALLAWFSLNPDKTYTTQIGERRSITLADGSIVELNARSRLSIHFSSAERHVDLVEGQALFDVAKDKQRPFVVRIGETRVRAVGTQFDIDRKSGGTTVTVLEGRVAVLTSLNSPVVSNEAATPASTLTAGRQEFATGAEPGGTLYVSEGQQTTVTAGSISAPLPANIEAATAWVRHTLVFEGSPLSSVVDDFNRYNQRQLIIEDRRLDHFHVSGVYSSTDSASLIRFLRAQPDILVIETDRNVRITHP